MGLISSFISNFIDLEIIYKDENGGKVVKTVKNGSTRVRKKDNYYDKKFENPKRYRVTKKLTEVLDIVGYELYDSIDDIYMEVYGDNILKYSNNISNGSFDRNPITGKIQFYSDSKNIPSQDIMMRGY